MYRRLGTHRKFSLYEALNCLELCKLLSRYLGKGRDLVQFAVR